MDIFSVFFTANQVYKNLLRDHPQVDLSVPGFGSGWSSEAMEMGVKIKAVEDTGKELSVSDVALYDRLPKQIKGILADVDTKLRAYLESLKSLPATFYQEFAASLEALFQNGLLPGFCGAFNSVLCNYFHVTIDTLPLERLQVTLKLEYPASISCYDTEKNCNAVFRFSDCSLLLTGFPEKELVNAALFDKIVPYKDVLVQEAIILEAYPQNLILMLPSLTKMCYLKEDMNNPFIETTDEILDSIVQQLVVMDAIDALQDIVLDDNAIYLCFDPCLEQEEMDLIIAALKAVYAQTQLVGIPDGKDCSWWIVEVTKIMGIASQVANAAPGNAPSVGQDGVIGKPGVDVLGDVNLSQVVNAVGKE